MSKILARRGRWSAYKLVLMQAAVAGGASVFFFALWGVQYGLSALAGAAIAVLPNFVFATLAFSHTRASASAKVVKEFYRVFDYLLCDEFKELSPQLVWQILHFCPSEVLIELSPVDKLSVEDFIQSTRLYSTCVFGLHRWLLVHSINTYDVEILPLISRILQKHSVESICHNYNFKGKKALNSHLLNYIKRHN